MFDAVDVACFEGDLAGCVAEQWIWAHELLTDPSQQEYLPILPISLAQALEHLKLYPSTYHIIQELLHIASSLTYLRIRGNLRNLIPLGNLWDLCAQVETFIHVVYSYLIALFIVFDEGDVVLEMQVVLFVGVKAAEYVESVNLLIRLVTRTPIPRDYVPIVLDIRDLHLKEEPRLIAISPEYIQSTLRNILLTYQPWKFILHIIKYIRPEHKHVFDCLEIVEVGVMLELR